MAQSGRYDALVALGAVIRGDTYHFDVVANESARGVMDVMLEFGVPVANGILTTDDERQAAARLEKAPRRCASRSRWRASSRSSMKHARRQAREVALQALYAWQLSGGDPLEEARSNETTRRPNSSRTWCAAWRRAAELERLIAPHLDRDFARLSPVERAILYIGAYELAQHPQTPFKVVLNEAVELGKSFGASEGYRFVNGVLEKIATQLRRKRWVAGATAPDGRIRADPPLFPARPPKRALLRTRTTARSCGPTPGSTSQ